MIELTVELKVVLFQMDLKYVYSREEECLCEENNYYINGLRKPNG